MRGEKKLTPELQKKICMFVAAGAPVPLAAAAARVSYDTVKTWMSPRYRNREPYKSFCEDVEAAKAAWACAAVMRITKAGKKGQWAADLAMLERRMPEHFRPAPQVMELSGRNGKAIEHKLSAKETLAEKLAKLAKKGAAQTNE